MSAAANEATASAPRVRAAAERIVVYQHSDLIYWWAVWAYGLLLRPADVVARQVRSCWSKADGPVLIYPARVARHLLCRADAVRDCCSPTPGRAA
jgi:hypothetical protein